MHPLTILLLSGGGHTGTNVMASLASRRAGLRLVATSDTPDEPSLFAFDAVYLAPKVAADAMGFEARVLEIIARENPDLVVPCRDEDVQWLARIRERRHDLAAKFLCGAHDMAVVMNDKWLSSEFSREHDLPFVPSLRCEDSNDARDQVDAFVRRHGLPLVAKPRHGVDSQGIDILTTAAQAVRAMQRPGYVLQEYLGESRPLQDYLTRLERDGIPLFHTFQGVKRSLQVLIAPDGGIEHIVCTRNQMIRHNARSVALDSEAEPRQIGDRCARAFAAAGWRGPLNIQCQPSATGKLMIHEFNARFTGATASRWHIGHDEVGTAIRAFTGQPVAPAFPFAGAPAVAMEGLWPRAADGRHVRTLAERGEWMRARE